MSAVNMVILVGNVGKDPEVKISKNGDAFATFSLATTYSYRPQSGGDRVDNTEWHRIVAWKTLADQAGKYVVKGRKVFVQGRIQSRQYTDNNNVQKTAYEIVATDIKFLDPPAKDVQALNGNGNDAPRSMTSKSPYAASDADNEMDLDDLPF